MGRFTIGKLGSNSLKNDLCISQSADGEIYVISDYHRSIVKLHCLKNAIGSNSVMRIGVMQPYFFPYLGYFHLAKAVDILVLTDDYKFTKQSWINRNRIISEKKIEYMTIPLMKSSDSTHINKKVIALDFKSNNLQNKLYNSYHSAVNYMGLCNILNSENFYPKANLFDALEKSLKVTLNYLGIKTAIMKTSEFQFPELATGKDKILQICSALGGSEYVNLSGGKSLYNSGDFSRASVKLSFVNSRFYEYKQNNEGFNSGLSIIDVIASNTYEDLIKTHLLSFELTSK